MNRRWIAWCEQTGRDRNKNFGGCNSNAEYIQWINEKAAAFRRYNNISNDHPVGALEEFTIFIENGGQQ